MPERKDYRAEQRIARKLGANKISRIGMRGPDLDGGWFICDIKYRSRPIRWLADALVHLKVQRDGPQLPFLVLCGPDQPEDLVVLSLADFIKQFGGAKEAPGGREQGP